jgi:ATP-binding protein involved in chromosome partitioning
MATVDQIIAVLTQLFNPKQIQGVVVKENGVASFTLLLVDGIKNPQRDALVDRAKSAVKQLAGVKDVWIKIGELPPQESAPSQNSSPIKQIIAVSSGKGGVGKTSVAVNLAVELADQGAQVGLLDADIYGPNVPQMLGMSFAKLEVFKDKEGKDIIEPVFNYGVKMVSMAFLIEKDQPVIWRGPMLNGVITQFFQQVNWGQLDYLVVDLPPGTGDAQITLVQAAPMAGAIIVTTPQTVALLDSRKGLKMFQNLGIKVLGIVENMSYFIPPDQPDRAYDIFGSGGGQRTAQELGVPLLGCIPLEICLREGGDRGVPIVLSQPNSASAQALRALAEKVRSLLPTDRA